ncbi:long-chain-fatty-acid--CoA ligase [Hazenella coriacea]|uniref:Long-chain acyl-CoA synthetase n=1 Tax=Hazenella coriacea TaxID=1179467 RepID=A0A4R3LA11_9BACL|nr:long-chain fatty acid--CoA ligase [Hazenella coriacea]TCS96663.1 long-chain acyl-CoA synthetase [Hazenella coriacea]
MATTEKIWLRHYPPQVPASLEYPRITLTQFLIDAATEFPERDAIEFLGKRISFRELLDEAYRFANVLKSLGVRKGERVSLMLPNSPQAVIAYYGSLIAGAVVVQFNPLYMERELEHQLNDSESETMVCLDLVYNKVRHVRKQTQLKRVIVTSLKEHLPFPKNWLYSIKTLLDGSYQKISYDETTLSYSQLMQKALPNEIDISDQSPEDLALLQYTGGTTGLAKGAMLTHSNLVANAIQSVAWMYKGKRGQEKVLGALPFFHVYGMTVVMNFAISIGATMILVPRFDRHQILKIINQKKPTYFPGAPTMYVSLINEPDIRKYDLSSIVACLSGSAPLPVDVQEKFEELTGGLLIEGYGMTETSPVTHANLIWDRVKNATIGLPWPDTDARIVDPSTKEVLEIGGVGELQVKGPQVMKGYWNRPDETKEMLQEDGWLSTGDIATMDEDGYFYILDRKKDMIIAGGLNIYPREVEEVLFEHPAIQEAAVVGVPHKYRGETVKAFIVLKSGKKVTEKELDKYCRKKLAAYKIPRIYEFRTELPKSSIGKVLRRVLQDESNKVNI